MTTKFIRIEGKEQLDKENLKRELGSHILSKGYALGNLRRIRIYSLKELDKPILGMLNTGCMTILKDKSTRSKKIAESGIPIFRLLRKGADVVSQLSCVADSSLGNWFMSIYGEENFKDMSRLSNELSSKIGIKITIRLEPRLHKEQYFNSPFSID